MGDDSAGGAGSVALPDQGCETLNLSDLPVMAWRSDRLGNRLEFNDAWLAFTGRRLDQERGSGWRENVHAADRLAHSESLDAALVERRPFQIQYRLRHRDGRFRTIVELGRPVQDSGEFSGFLGVCLDVSDHGDGLHRVFSEHARDALLLIGRDGEILEANPAAEQMYGCSREELRRLKIPDLRAPETLEELPAQAARAWSAGVLFETVHRRRDGRRIAVEVSAQAAEVGGRPVLVSIVRDVSERNRIRRQLSASQADYRALFENMREGTAIHELVRDAAGTAVDYIITEVNPAFSVQTGLAHEQVVGRRASAAYGTGDPPYLDTYARVTETGSPSSFEVYFEPLKKHFVISAFALGEDRFATVFADISERKKVDDQLRQAQKMEAVGRLAGGIAHDFNNLLTVILGYGGFLQESIQPESPLFEAVRNIQDAGERASRLTAQLLAFGRRQLLRLQVLNLNTVVAETGRMLKRLIGEDVELVTELEPQLGRVRADAGQVTQVLLNLAVNARDAMPRGGKLTIQTANAELDETYVRAHPGVRPGHYVLLTVTDTGSGMDAETQTHIFEPFFTTKPPGEGTGLGLSTVYGIVKQSGGEIGVYSEVGYGTSFKVYLPLVEGGKAAKEARERPRPAAGRETVLIVEDEPAVASLISTSLAKLGYRVLSAPMAEDALRLWREHRAAIELVITDVVLPGMSGPEMARKIEAEGSAVPVLYTSGYPNPAALRHGVALDRAHFLHKPFSSRELGEKVRALLDGSARRRKSRAS